MQAVVVLVAVAILVAGVAVGVAVVPAYTIIHSVTSPHASATILQTKNNKMFILWLSVLIRMRVGTKKHLGLG